MVLVTGAARGLGAALARRLAADGARLALVGLEPARLQALAEELGPEAAWWECDVRALADVERAVGAAAERFGRLDVVVANAGVQVFGSVEHADPDAVARVVDVNLLGPWRTLRAAAPHLVSARGHAVVVSSMAYAVWSPMQAQYSMSKAGLTALAGTFRLELKGTGATVGVVHPTFVATDMVTRDTHGDPVGRALWGGNRRHGLWATVQPDEVVDAVVDGMRRRARRVVVPRRLTPVVVAPGLFQPVAERVFTARRVARLRALESEQLRRGAP